MSPAWIVVDVPIPLRRCSSLTVVPTFRAIPYSVSPSRTRYVAAGAALELAELGAGVGETAGFRVGGGDVGAAVGDAGGAEGAAVVAVGIGVAGTTASNDGAADGDDEAPAANAAGAPPNDGRAIPTIPRTAIAIRASAAIESCTRLRFRTDATAAGTRGWSRTTGRVRTSDQRVTVSPPGRLSGDDLLAERRSRGQRASSRPPTAPSRGRSSDSRPAATRKVEQPACRSERHSRRCFSSARSVGGVTAPHR